MMQKIFKDFFTTDKGLVRSENEDCYGVLYSEANHLNGDLFVVCDGMGGHVGGKMASQIATATILNFFQSEFHDNPIIAIEKSISLAHNAILKKVDENLELKGMGTTCVVVLIRENDVFVGHVGDSRLYVVSDNEIYRLTKDHSYVQQLVDDNQLSMDEMENHPRKNELTQALGVTNHIKPTITFKPLKFKNSDKLLLCSDGLCGLVHDNEILNVILKSDELERVGAGLVASAYNQGAHDNITLGVIEFVNSKYTYSDFKSNNTFTQTNTNNDFSSTKEVEFDNRKDILANYFERLKYVYRRNKNIFYGLLLLVLIIPIYRSVFHENPDPKIKNPDPVIKKFLDVYKESEVIYAEYEPGKGWEEFDFKETFTKKVNAENFVIKGVNEKHQQFWIDGKVMCLDSARYYYKPESNSKTFKQGDIIFVVRDSLFKKEERNSESSIVKRKRKSNTIKRKEIEQNEGEISKERTSGSSGESGEKDKMDAFKKEVDALKKKGYKKGGLPKGKEGDEVTVLSPDGDKQMYHKVGEETPEIETEPNTETETDNTETGTDNTETGTDNTDNNTETGETETETGEIETGDGEIETGDGETETGDGETGDGETGDGETDETETGDGETGAKGERGNEKTLKEKRGKREKRKATDVVKEEDLKKDGNSENNR